VRAFRSWSRPTASRFVAARGVVAASGVAQRAAWGGYAALLGFVWIGLAGCGATATTFRAETVPSVPTARDAAVYALGRGLFEAVQAADVERVLFDDLELRVLLDGAGASRTTAMRHAAGPGLRAESEPLALAVAGARFVGVCLQESAVAPVGGTLGLRQEAWVVGRALLVADHPRVGRAAGWAEGVFVHSSRGFGAITIDRIEPLRPAHSDLELASCDMAAGLDE